MPQELHVLRCFSCDTFQVHIVKKSSSKWQCKMCGEKQSVKQVYGRGSGKDCRLHVQKLNDLRRQKVDHAHMFVTGNTDEYPEFECRTEETCVSPLCDTLSSQGKVKQLQPSSKWSEYVSDNSNHSDTGQFETLSPLQKTSLQEINYSQNSRHKTAGKNVSEEVSDHQNAYSDRFVEVDADSKKRKKDCSSFDVNVCGSSKWAEFVDRDNLGSASSVLTIPTREDAGKHKLNFDTQNSFPKSSENCNARWGCVSGGDENNVMGISEENTSQCFSESALSRTQISENKFMKGSCSRNVFAFPPKQTVIAQKRSLCSVFGTDRGLYHDSILESAAIQDCSKTAQKSAETGKDSLSFDLHAWSNNVSILPEESGSLSHPSEKLQPFSRGDNPKVCPV